MIQAIKQFEENPWIMALAVVVSNLGINFIKDDLSKKQQDFLNNYVLRKIYIFALIYCGTKNIIISLICTLLYSIIVHWL